MFSRKEKALYGIDTSAPGLEIGPSHRPFAPKKEGFNVSILDHLNQEQLIEKYKSHNLDLTNIEPVDYIWKWGVLC